jgi:OPT oligopeptide transporter protein
VVCTGIALGAAAACVNFLGFLKTGWSFPMALPALLVAVSVLPRSTNASQLAQITIAASAAGFMTAGGNLAAFPAWDSAVGAPPSAFVYAVWLVLVAAYGAGIGWAFRAAILSQTVNRFPSAVAAANFIQGITQQSRARLVPLLRWSFAFGAGIMPLRRAFGLPAVVSAAPFAFDLSAVTLGMGALLPLRVAATAALSAGALHAFVLPAMIRAGWITDARPLSVAMFMAWPAVMLMVTAALADALLRVRISAWRGWPTLDLRACAAGFVAGAGLLVIGHYALGISKAALGIALVLAVPAGLLSAYALGATDVVPTRAIAPVAQLALAAAPNAVFLGNCMGANLICGSGVSSAVVLAHARLASLVDGVPQWKRAHAIGVLTGAAVLSVLFTYLFQGKHLLGTLEWPAPGVLLWQRVAQDLATGGVSITLAQRYATLIAIAVGVGVSVAERRWGTRWVPSAAAIGGSLVLPIAPTITMFVGALAAHLRLRKDQASIVPSAIAAGLIGGDAASSVVALVLHRFT